MRKKDTEKITSKSTLKDKIEERRQMKEDKEDSCMDKRKRRMTSFS